MRVVGIKLLKNKLSEYVKLAAGGERVLITDRDRVVAELVAPRVEADPRMQDPRWADAVRKGIITPALVHGTTPPPRHPVMQFDELMDQLDASRADR